MHWSRIMPSTATNSAGPSGGIDGGASTNHRYFVSTAVFLAELVKLSVSLSLTIYQTSKTLAPRTPATVLLEQVGDSVLLSGRGRDGWKLALPAAFYTLQNLLQYIAVGNLDVVQFQVLYQLKILTTAIFSVVLLHRPLGSKRWMALLVLTVGVCIVSIPSKTSSPSSFRVPFSTRRSSRTFLFHDIPGHYHYFRDPAHYPCHDHTTSSHLDTRHAGDVSRLARRSATYQGMEADQSSSASSGAGMNHSLGLTSVLIAATVSGLTGVCFEKVLKESPSQASVWTRNIQLSFFSLLTVLFGGIWWQDGDGIRQFGFFAGYNWVVWTVILLQALGGLVASVVIRDADNIAKNFATSISIVVSFLVSVWLFEFTVSTTFFLGTSLVLYATFMYTGIERGGKGRPMHNKAPSPDIRIANFEKTMIEPVLTPRGTPKTIDSARLNANPFDNSNSNNNNNRTLGDGLMSTTSISRPGTPAALLRTASRSNLHHRDG